MLNPDKLAHHAEQLRSVLAGAGRVYAASPEDQRTAVLAALEAVYEFVEDVALEGVDALPKGEMLKPLSAIYMAFADLDRGVTPPLLKPKLVGDKLGRGRRRDSLGREQMKGGVAAAMSLLMIFGFTLEDAGKLVAKELRRLKVGSEASAATGAPSQAGASCAWPRRRVATRRSAWRPTTASSWT